ncbi:MAG: pantoate--beta-alanine ligase [Cytophagales bacterium]|nr:pantoate--beta-alanine ligase [Cytophagales bacterium]
MKIFHTSTQLRAYLDERKHLTRGFVPTMGNLHAGHLALIAQAKASSDITIASIFVNRLQFLPHEDFDSYPRTWDDDVQALTDAGCDLLFAPNEAELYPEPQTYKVHPTPELADKLEGEFRPGFFTGVCTVVMKLFQIVQPDVAVFGKKDYQQLAVIRGMARQFALPITIVAGETLRADDGLALSSRNRYLSADERQAAVGLSQTLRAMTEAALMPQANIQKIEADALETMRNKGWQPDYLTIRTQQGLRAIDPAQREPWVVLGAAKLGKTRLIDNLEF